MLHIRNPLSPTGSANSLRRRWKYAGRCAGALSLALLAVPAAADEATKANQDLARSVAVTGREAFNAGDYETAAALFRRAYALFPAPTVVLYEARSLEKLGRWIEAVEAYTRTTQVHLESGSPAQFAEAITAAHQEGQQLRARIPTLTVQVSGVSGNDPNLRLEINGRAIGAAQLGQALSLNPGAYRVAGSVGAERRDESEAVLKSGSKVSVVLDLAPAELQAPLPDPVPSDVDAERASTIPQLAYVAGAVGLAGIGAGVVTGVVAKGKHSEAQSKCGGTECVVGTDGPSAVESFRTWRTVSTVSYGVGVAGLAAGVVIWLMADDAPDTEHAGMKPWIGVGSAGLEGRF